MGILVAMHYPTAVFANLADHTYVKCSTGGKAWACWGGKSGGTAIRQGTGSTRRADRIARPDEKAGITCYLINGVCHQAANRILLPAGITVRGARGYSLSEALFGTYGRVGIWPCRAPFNRWPGVSGDLPACVPPAPPAPRSRARGTTRKGVARSVADKLDWQYLKDVKSMYGKAKDLLAAKSLDTPGARAFSVRLFMHQAAFNLGPMLDRPLERKLKDVRLTTEKTRVKTEAAFAKGQMTPDEFVDEFNKLTIKFQDKMANTLKAEQYETLFDLKPGERVILADPRIVKKAFAKG